MESNKISKIIKGVLIAVAVLVVVMLCSVTVPTGHTGVITVFGKVQDRTLESGLHFKAPWQSVHNMDNRIQKDSVDLQCFSSDIQEVTMTYTLNYEIDKTNAQKLYATVGPEYYSTVIAPCITESVKTVSAKYTAELLVADRAGLADGIEKELSARLEQYGIVLVSTSIENLDFTDAFTDAVEAKQVAAQNKLRAQTEAEQKRIEAQAAADIKVIEAKAEADALLARADAEAEANKKIGESLTEEILKEKYYEKWNGVLPQTVLGNDPSVIIEP